jgi:hypothetical protein
MGWKANPPNRRLWKTLAALCGLVLKCFIYLYLQRLPVTPFVLDSFSPV